jgi:hypothetical protein
VVRGECKGPQKQRKFNNINEGKQKDRLLFVSEQAKARLFAVTKRKGHKVSISKRRQPQKKREGGGMGENNACTKNGGHEAQSSK